MCRTADKSICYHHIGLKISNISTVKIPASEITMAMCKVCELAGISIKTKGSSVSSVKHSV